jgi:hypothetical protein
VAAALVLSGGWSSWAGVGLVFAEELEKNYRFVSGFGLFHVLLFGYVFGSFHIGLVEFVIVGQ